MRVAVFGGGGFIGTNLCRHLREDGADVIAFGRSCPFPEALAGSRFVTGSFSDAAAVAGALEGADAAVHLISTTTPASSNADMETDVADNVLSTIRFLDACVAAGTRRVVFLSSGGTVYGIPRETPIHESAATEPISSYGITRLVIEKYLGLYRHLHGLDPVVLRVANPYGPFQRPHGQQGVIAAFLKRALAGEPIEIFGDGGIVRDYVYIDDVCEATRRAIGYRGTESVFNIGSGVGRSVNEVAASLSAALGTEIAIERRPGRAVDVPVSVLDITRAREGLGWAPRTAWEDGLRKAVDWARGQAGIRP